MLGLDQVFPNINKFGGHLSKQDSTGQKVDLKVVTLKMLFLPQGVSMATCFTCSRHDERRAETQEDVLRDSGRCQQSRPGDDCLLTTTGSR